MAEHIKINSEDVTPLTRDTGHGHDVVNVAKHLNSKTGRRAHPFPSRWLNSPTLSTTRKHTFPIIPKICAAICRAKRRQNNGKP